MARLSPEEGFKVLKDRVSETVGGLFPIVGKRHTLEIKDVLVKDTLSIDDIRSQKEAKVAGRTWSVPVEATVSLTDNQTGKVVDKQQIRLLNLPKYTRRHSHIVDGQEYQLDNQWRLKSGVYARVKDNGELQSSFNLAKGRGFSLEFDPKSREFNMAYGTSNVPLAPLMQELGVHPEDIKERWGSAIAQANAKDQEQAVLKFYKASTGSKPTDIEQARKHLKDTFAGTQLRGDTTKVTLGTSYTKVTGPALFDAATKLLHVSQGKAEPDPRDSLQFKELHSTEDFFAERIQKGTVDIMRRVQNTLDKKQKVRDIIGPDIFNRPIKTMYRTSLANIPDQTNPLEMLSGQQKTTITGEGGIKSAHGISEEAKLVDPSHLGFLDPIHTPEGQTTGVTLRLPLGAKKRGHDVTIKMFNLKTGKNEDVNPEKALASNVVLPDQVTWKGGKPVAAGKSIKISGPGNEVIEGGLKKADYVMRDPIQMFSMASNLVPFIASDHPNRSTMAGRHMEQAIPLAAREAPLVQSMAAKKTFEQVMGQYAGHTSRVGGTVTAVKSDGIMIKDSAGTEHEVQLYDRFPLNADKGFLHSTPMVQVGDKVKKGQAVADTNFTKNGTLALGTNLKVGYMPYKGYNFEDGVVISESAAQKLSSEHLHRKTLERDKQILLSKSKFQAYTPDAMTRVQADKLDDTGVVKPGQLVLPGDTLIAALRERTDRREDKELSMMHKSLVRPYTDVSVKWEADHPGIVQEVIRKGKKTAVHIKTLEPAEIGDKLAGRHGNKGIICFSNDSEVLTDNGWIRWPDLGRQERICTRNPDTGEIEYQRPTNYIVRHYRGKMYLYEGRRLNLCVTPEHNHYVRTRRGQFHLESAESCFGLPRIHLRTGLWKGSGLDCIRIEGRPRESQHKIDYSEDLALDADLFLELFGFWITEGHLSGDYYAVLSQSKEAHPETYDRIVEVVEGLGFIPTLSPTTISIADVRLVGWLKKFGKSHDKYIPRTFLDLCPRQLRIMADAIFQGDGGVYYREKDNHIRYELFTSSRRLADDYQELALKMGFSANVKPQPGEYGTEYVVRWSLKDEVWTNNDNRYDNEQWIDYDNMIYCVEVPNHIIYVRRKGIPVWSGNCKILPDNEMPQLKNGTPLQVLLNPTGIPGRTNLGQMLETAAGKIAEKTGHTYTIKNFQPNEDLHAKVVADLKKHGLEDKEDIVDPITGRTLGSVLTGPQYIVKLKHQVEKKLVARAGGPGYAYDRNLVPKGGGPHGAQALGTLGLYSMLAHGAKANLREMQTLKSDAGQNDEFWSALQAGEPLPAPRPTFAYNKFTSYLNALGVNVKKDGNNLQLVPFTDKQVTEMSNGEIKDAGRMVRAKDLKPEEGGLFDPKVTGGLEGTKWGHIRLAEALPNPLFERAIQSLTGLDQKQYLDVVTGKKSIDKQGKVVTDLDAGVTGGPAVAGLLKKIDTAAALAEAQKALQNPKLKGNRLDQANKRVKFLSALNSAGLNPHDAYMMNNVPVLPPSMRPLSQLPNGDLNFDDLNGLYKGIHLTSHQLKNASDALPEEEKQETREELYDGLRALTGLAGNPRREFRGILDILGGKRLETSGGFATGKKLGSPKEGFFQKKLVQRKQDLSMRSTIVPEPGLGLDEVGLPRQAALEIYKPFVIRELRGMTGITPLEAQQQVKQGGELVNRALERVVENRPVLLKRDPALHKYSVQAFKSRIVGGKAVQIHPLVTSGYNADFNGDSCNPTTLLLFSIDGEIKFGSFWELAQILLPNSTEDDQLELAKGGTAILQLSPGLRVLSRVPGTGMRWVDASEFTIHSSHGPAFNLKTHIGRSVEVSEHHNFLTVDSEMCCQKVKTDRMESGQLVPFVRSLDLEEEEGHITIGGREINLDNDAGWFFGYYAGDGSITGRWDTVSLTCGDNDKHPILKEAFDRMGFRSWDEPNRSVRATDKKLVAFMEQFGHGAPNKTVPGFLFQSPRGCREGFIAGLLDAEGNTYIDVNSDLHVRMEVTSRSLIEGTAWLLASLGLGCYIRKGKEPTESTLRTYVLEIDRASLDEIRLFKFPEKEIIVSEGLSRGRSVIRSRYDLVPFCTALAELFIQKGRHKKSNRVECPYKSKEVRKYGEAGYLTRSAAQRLILKYGPIDDVLYRRWEAFVEDRSVGWTLVESIEEADRPTLMYDFSVPQGDETFSVSGGLITRNTMAAFVPVSNEAVDEAKQMYPSRNLFSPSTGNLMYTPTLETQLGLYGITQVGKKTAHDFKDIKEVHSAVNKGTVGFNDHVKVGGITSTTGRFLLGEALPEAMRSDFLKKSGPMTKGDQRDLLTTLAEKHRNDYGDVVNKLKDLGNRWSTETAFSLGLEDIKPEKAMRDRVLKAADKRAVVGGTDAKAIQSYDKATQEMSKQIERMPKQGKGSNLMLMYRAGIKPTMDTLRQIKMAPMLISNAKGEIIPTPVRKSYAEGLDLADYWTSMSGARKGIIQKVQQVQEPGYLSKQVMNSVMNNTIASDDCGTTKGISLPVDEKDVLDRYLASAVKAGNKTFAAGTLITPEVRNSLRNNKVGKVVVRSPLRCQHGPGICQKCYGLTEDGKAPEMGLNVGVLAGQALGERSTQLAMKSFHTGGTVATKEGLVDEFQKVKNLLLFPKTLPGAATLSTVSGTVEKVEKDPAGGHNVYVNGQRHYVPQNRGVPTLGGKILRRGMDVKKGVALSRGPVNPHEMLPLTGVEPVQGYLSNELHTIYGPHGIRRRNTEVVVKALTNLTKVDDPGEYGPYIRGDFASQTEIANLNRQNKGSKPIKHTPVLKGVNMLPLDMQEDWIARMNHQRLSQTVVEAAQQGWTSKLHGKHPIPPVVYGADLGKNKKPGEY